MKQTLSIEQMQHLQELGLDLKETFLLWCVKGDSVVLFPAWMVNKDGWDYTIPAYTLQDVLDALPEDIEYDGFYYTLLMTKSDVYYMLGCIDGIDKIIDHTIEGELIDMAYKTLCWCLGHNLKEKDEIKKD